ncbi:MAG TPA: hypothetical protein VH560_02855, partial [Polyangia bacterium]|nr:hypothetical protein [Polyangia bacterium]
MIARLALTSALVLSLDGPSSVAPIPAQPGPAENAANVSISSHIVQPRQLPPPDLSALKVPVGFRVTRFADKLGNIRVLAVANDGTVYATRRDEGDVIMLKDPGNGAPAAAPVRV